MAALLLAVSAPLARAGDDSLSRCGSDFKTEIADAVADHDTREVMLEFTSIPSFAPEWTAALIRDRDRTELRVLKFRRSVWHGAYREVRPGVFDRVPSKATYKHYTGRVTISEDTAQLLRTAVAAEIRGDEKLQRGLDGEDYYFSTGGRCGSAWSPDPSTASAKLIRVFDDLKIQAFLPTRLLQLFWERKVHMELVAMAGYAHPMTPLREYLLVAGLAILILAAVSLPLLVSCVVMQIPSRLNHRRKFVLFAGSMSYGCTCLVGLLLLPIYMVSAIGSAFIYVGNPSDWADRLEDMRDFLPFILFGVWLFLSVAVPIWLRRKVWSHLLGGLISGSSFARRQTP